MTKIHEVLTYCEAFAPLRLAESWDNVGLLLGEDSATAKRVMTCLTVTPAVVAEAIERHADLIVSHHPVIFRPIGRVTRETTVGAMVLDLIGAGVTVYSPHTALDSAASGINQSLAEGMGLREIQPLRLVEGISRPIDEAGEAPDGPIEGVGRFGHLPKALRLDTIAKRLRDLVAAERMDVVGEVSRKIQTIATTCGAADELVDDAIARGADCVVIGEARFHTCLAAQAADVCLLMPGHFASERFAVEKLADRLAEKFSQVEVWASTQDRDPIRRL